MDKINPIKQEDIERILEMAWEDRTPFDAIERQFGIPENETIKIMRQELKQIPSNCGGSGFREDQPNMQQGHLRRFLALSQGCKKESLEIKSVRKPKKLPWST